MIHHDIILKTDEVEIETTDVEDQDDEMLWENPIETDIDAVMKTDMNYGYSRLTMKQRAVANQLHFPFDNEDTSHCSSHTKNGDNTRQIKEEAVTFPYKVGYGCRMPTWYTEMYQQVMSCKVRSTREISITLINPLMRM